MRTAPPLDRPAAAVEDHEPEVDQGRADGGVQQAGEPAVGQRGGDDLVAGRDVDALALEQREHGALVQLVEVEAHLEVGRDVGDDVADRLLVQQPDVGGPLHTGAVGELEVLAGLGVGRLLLDLGAGDPGVLAEPLDLAQQLLHVADDGRVGKVLDHEGAAARLADDQGFVDQHVHRLAGGDAGDAEEVAELPFRGQALAGLVGALEDPVPDGGVDLDVAGAAERIVHGLPGTAGGAICHGHQGIRRPRMRAGSRCINIMTTS